MPIEEEEVVVVAVVYTSRTCVEIDLKRLLININPLKTDNATVFSCPALLRFSEQQSCV
jgi:hypothetical protein